VTDTNLPVTRITAEDKKKTDEACAKFDPRRDGFFTATWERMVPYAGAYFAHILLAAKNTGPLGFACSDGYAALSEAQRHSKISNIADREIASIDECLRAKPADDPCYQIQFSGNAETLQIHLRVQNEQDRVYRAEFLELVTLGDPWP
jgi:hypothetical protein